VPTNIVNQPGVILGQPEFHESTDSGNTTSLKANQMSRKLANVAQVSFTLPTDDYSVVSDRVATGLKPSLDTLDRLAAAGVRTVVYLGSETSITAADRRVCSARGMEIIVVSPEKPCTETNSQLKHGRTYVYSTDAVTLRNWWHRYFRQVESLSDEAAQIRADRIASRS